jgi:hypothetical protein
MGGKRGGRRRAIGTSAPMALPQGPDQRWSLDFVSDASLSGIRVARELDRIVERRGPPCLVTSDNGTNGSSKPGVSTTTPHDHTRASAGSRRRSLQHAPARGHN